MKIRMKLANGIEIVGEDKEEVRGVRRGDLGERFMRNITVGDFVSVSEFGAGFVAVRVVAVEEVVEAVPVAEAACEEGGVA